MIYYNDVIFSKEECVKILDSADNFIQSVVGVNYNSKMYDLVENTKKRKSTQCELTSTIDSFIYKKLNEIINTFNYELVCDVLYYDVIKYNEDDFVWKHKDANDVRIFTIVIQLSESDSYEGGEFKYWLGDIEYEMDKNIGHGIAFKSNVFHEVKPVTKRERYSFVSFIKLSDVKRLGKPGLI